MAKQKAKVANGKIAGIEQKGFRLFDVHARLGQFKPGEMPTNGTQEIQLAIHQIDAKNNVAHVVLSFRFTLAYHQPESIGPPPLQITTQYIVQYAITGDADPKDFEKVFQQTNLVSTVWPYWSELAQSLCIRFGLPPIQVPGPPDLAAPAKQSGKQKPSKTSSKK